jgi:hypothetical protein
VRSEFVMFGPLDMYRLTLDVLYDDNGDWHEDLLAQLGNNSPLNGIVNGVAPLRELVLRPLSLANIV